MKYKLKVIQTLKDLRNIDCDVVTFGQYLRPSRRHMPVSIPFILYIHYIYTYIHTYLHTYPIYIHIYTYTHIIHIYIYIYCQ